ncbi:MAG: hypothetical protein ACYCZN_11700 [Candidatus Dormibacteria bacterium]
MDAVTLDSAWFKWDWAVRHSQLLKADIDRALKSDGDSSDSVLGIGHNYDPKLQCWVIRVTHVGATPIRFSLIAGDLIQNFRSALDHLAWFLVQRIPRDVPLPDDELKRVYFPICDSEGQFDRSVPTKLPGVGDTDLAIISQFQPYFIGDEGKAWHAFRILADLSDHDKHRTLQPVALRLNTVTCRALNSRDCVVWRITPVTTADPLQVNMKLASIFARKTGPKPTFEVEIEPTADVAFNGNVWVKDFLDRVQENVFKLLLAFGNPPDELVISESDDGHEEAPGRAS